MPGDPTFGDSVGRALAPVGALVSVGIPLGMIWFGNRLYAAIGWIFLLIFVVVIPLVGVLHSR